MLGRSCRDGHAADGDLVARVDFDDVVDPAEQALPRSARHDGLGASGNACERRDIEVVVVRM